MKRRLLTFAVVIFALAGVFLASVPFVQSMWPNDRQISKLPHVDISNLGNGQYIEAQGTWYKAYILKTIEGELKIFSIPFWEGKYRMPDLSWRRAWLPCDKFGPEADGSNLKENGHFRCIDESEGDEAWWKENQRWSFDGKSLEQYTEDLMVPRYEQRGNTIILGKSEH